MVSRHLVLKFNDEIALFLPSPLINVSSGDISDAEMRKLFIFVVLGATFLMFTERYNIILANSNNQNWGSYC